MEGATNMRKLASLLVASIVLAAACSSSSGTKQPAPPTGGGTPTTAASQGGNGGNGGNLGSGSATVTIGGSNVTLSGGLCNDGGAVGVDVRFGDITSESADWFVALIHHGGSGKPIVSGRVGGKLFVLGADATGTIGADGKGTFSGTDSAGGNGKITATFSCS
jgi:hypothetical protein